MTMTQKHALTLALLLASISSMLPAQEQSAPKVPAQMPIKKFPKAVSQHTAVSGEEVFAQNCSRCHAAPQSFAPRISGTVLMHMRVRASLSQEETQALMRFFNP
jgi:cytochrome c5